MVCCKSIKLGLFCDNILLLILWLSFLGPTEHDLLANLDDVEKHALPIEKMKMAYSDLNTAKNMILSGMTFCHTRVNVMLDLARV